MKVQKVYLETTLFNYYFDEDRDAHADTITLFEECAAGRFEPYTSLYVIDELEDAPSEKRDKMIALIERYEITVLAASDEADNLARRYISEGALPQGSLSDASHIAAASVNALDKLSALISDTLLEKRPLSLRGRSIHC